MKRICLFLLCLLLLAGCAVNPQISETETLQTNPVQTEPSATQSAVYSFWVEPTEVHMTEQLIAKLNTAFPDTIKRGTVINAGQAAQGLCFTPDSNKKYQTVEGFGASGCWWACFSDTWTDAQLDEALNLLYSKQYGIGLTSFRHNIGGGTSEGFSGKGATKCVELFPGYYDLSQDEQGVKVLYKLQSLGVDYFTLFMNSPPARMTKSGSTLGNIDGSSNLSEECYEEYASFCADIVELYEKAGIPVKYLSPVNEPQWEWKASTWQEGCHYTSAEVAKLDVLVAQEFARRGLTTKVSIPETAAWYDDIYSRYLVSQLYRDKNLEGKIDHIAGHSYGSKTQHKTALAEFYAQMKMELPVHQTEWCIEQSREEDPCRLSVCRTLHDDLTILNCSLWEWWVAIEPPGSHEGGGALMFLDEQSDAVVPNIQFYYLGQYSRFVTGATRVELNTDTENEQVYGSAYVKDGKTILILTNESEQPQSVCFGSLSGTGEAWQTSQTLRLQYIGDVDAAAGFELAPQSVTTIVFEN